MPGRKVIVALLRNDLRCHDNAILHAVHTSANSEVTHLLPLFVFDERTIELSGLPGYKREGPEARTRVCGFWRTGVYRARFLAEAVYDLRDRLRGRNSDLLVRFGKAEEVAAKVVKALQANGDEVKGVFMQKEFYSEELAVEDRLERLLLKLGVRVTFFDTTPLVHVRDLPFPISQVPDVFTPFRKRVEAMGKLGRDPLDMPKQFKPFPKPSGPSATPSYGSVFDNKGVEDLLPYLFKPLEDSFDTKSNSAERPHHPKSAVPFAGGETAALARLEWYFHHGSPPAVARYKETRNGLLGHEYSTKFSPYLSLGSLSPRLIMQSLDEHERKFGESQNTYWVRFELLWRDYFMLIARKFGTKLFTLGGFEEVTDPKQARIRTTPGWWSSWDPAAGPDTPIARWIAGRTGVPFIDANMAELRETGFMSNRGRQNVASFLTKDLQVDWRIGGELFESYLIDHEPGANYGNWQYLAGCGNDPRASRQFNPIKQQNDYDPAGAYVKTWLPQLAGVPVHRIMAPWLLSPADRSLYISGDYPATPVLEQSNWQPHYKKRGPPKTNGNPNERVKNPGPGGGRPRDGAEGSARGGRGGGRGGAPALRGRGNGNHT